MEHVYLNFVKRVMNKGVDRGDRTGTGTKALFGESLRFDLKLGFPLLTTKKMHLKSIIHELLWMVSGSTNIKYLQENGVRIWNEWADENGELGPVYGSQWRSWSKFHNDDIGPGISRDLEGIDQLANVIESLKENPYSRRHMINAWNVGEIEEMRLPPCHYSIQFFVKPNPDGGKPRLSCIFVMRSVDIFLGMPFDIALYSLLTMMVAQVCGYEADEVIGQFGDTHLYNNHWEQATKQIARQPHLAPKMVINPTVQDIDDFKFDDFSLEYYKHHPAIKAEVSV